MTIKIQDSKTNGLEYKYDQQILTTITRRKVSYNIQKKPSISTGLMAMQ